MKLDADIAGGFGGDEIDFCGGGKRLADGVEGGGDVVMSGEKIRGARNLRMERRCGQERENQREQTGSARKCSTAGHRSSFHAIQYSNPMYTHDDTKDLTLRRFWRRSEA